MNPELTGLSAALGVALIASVTDIRERRIPNALIVVGLVVAAAIVTVSGVWLDALAGSGLGIATLALPRLVARDAVGLGDIKLVGVLGLDAGMAGIMIVIGLAVAVAMPVALWDRREQSCRRRIPFAPFLAVGVAGYLAVRFAVGDS